MKAFVTGSTGLVGNNLVKLLVENGHSVKALVRSEEKGRKLLGATGAMLIKGNMLQVEGFVEQLQGCDAVFHTAAYFREYYGPGDHQKALEDVNIKGTLALMDAAEERGVRRFVHVSSAGTIGQRLDGLPGDEETTATADQLTNLYVKSKLDGDARIRGWRGSGAMTVVEILPGWIWGPGDAAPTAAGQMALDFLAEKIPAILDGGACIVDARDVATAMLSSVERGRHGESYIVGGEFHTLEEILEELEQASGIAGPRLHLPYFAAVALAVAIETRARLTGKPALINRQGIRLMHAKHRVSSAKAGKELGATFRPLRDTIRDVVAWYRHNQVIPTVVSQVA